ncbi:MAG: hypothetical protein ABJ205_07840 [Erythrobacter sp.]|uniref:hypothetical protein n=1 Tax=Erythrobacter sp. TaxID=1042 RepID=UPI003264211C
MKKFAISVKHLAACAAIGTAWAHPAVAQDAPIKTVFLEKTDGAQNVTVKATGTVCSLIWLDNAQNNSFSISIGKTVITSQIILFSTENIGEHAGQMTLRRLTTDGIKSVTTQFSKGVAGRFEDIVLYKYIASLYRLGLDFSVLEQSGDLLLQTDTDGPAIFSFRGVLRDEAVEALGTCLASQAQHWTMEQGTDM